MKFLAQNHSWQAFTFFSATLPRPPVLSPDRAYLCHAQVGDRVRIVDIFCSSCRSDLASRGVFPGIEVEISSVTSSGSVVFTSGRKSIGLSAAITCQISVTRVA
jgi:hypothetical protein